MRVEPHIDPSRDEEWIRLDIEKTRVESVIRMLVGNTSPDDIRRLEKLWLTPVRDKLRDHHLEYDANTNRGDGAGSVIA